MVALVGLGLDAVFQRVPQLLPVMRILGSLYMLWLAMKIAFAGPIGEVEGEACAGCVFASPHRDDFSAILCRFECLSLKVGFR